MGSAASGCRIDFTAAYRRHAGSSRNRHAWRKKDLRAGRGGSDARQRCHVLGEATRITGGFHMVERAMPAAGAHSGPQRGARLRIGQGPDSDGRWPGPCPARHTPMQALPRPGWTGSPSRPVCRRGIAGAASRTKPASAHRGNTTRPGDETRKNAWHGNLCGRRRARPTRAHTHVCAANASRLIASCLITFHALAVCACSAATCRGSRPRTHGMRFSAPAAARRAPARKSRTRCRCRAQPDRASCRRNRCAKECRVSG